MCLKLNSFQITFDRFQKSEKVAPNYFKEMITVSTNDFYQLRSLDDSNYSPPVLNDQFFVVMFFVYALRISNELSLQFHSQHILAILSKT